MSSRFTTVLAAVGASGALIAGGLAFGGSPASATVDSAPKQAAYNCDVSGILQFPITADFTSLPAFPDTATTGVTIPALAESADITVPAAVAQQLANFGITEVEGNITGNTGFGAQPVKTVLSVPKTTLSSTGDTVIHSTGKTTAFAPTTAGTAALTLPSKITAALVSGFPANCTLDSGSDANFGSVEVAQGSTTTPPPAAKPVITATAPKTATAGKSVTVKVTVKNAKTGKVTAKLGKKAFSASLKAGKASVVVKGIKKGVNKIVVSFPKAASKTLKVTGK